MEFNHENIKKTLAGANPAPENEKKAEALADAIAVSLKIANFAEVKLGKDVGELVKKAEFLSGIKAVESEKTAATIGNAEDAEFHKIAAAFGEETAIAVSESVTKVSGLMEVTGLSPDELMMSMSLTAAEAAEKRANLAAAGYNKSEIESIIADWM